jgi:lysozyme family protein
MYWDAQRCDELPSGVDYTVFDYGVNSGIGRAKKVLQRVVGVTDDGELGPITMRAVAAHDPQTIITAVNDERLRFLQSLKTWRIFGKGWQRRVSDVRAASLALAQASSSVGAFDDALPRGNAAPAPAPGKGAVPPPQTLHSAIQGGGIGAAIAGAAASHAAIIAHPGTAALIAVTALAVAAIAVWLTAKRHRRRQEAPSAAPAALAS